MRLLNTSTLSPEEFQGSRIPKYAILSHTWSAEELTYQEVIQSNQAVKAKLGFLKIQSVCELVKDRGFDHVWIDTCCIDKQCSAEVTEAINSMFSWYQQAEICIIHLDDITPARLDTASVEESQIDLLRSCRWFTRGWTLQELIASRKRLFVSSDWQVLDFDEVKVCSAITGIDRAVLSHTRKLTKACVAERMSWAAARETTRVEDRAYSLMGLFQVNMPVLYGEGIHSAFRRLQEEIMKRTFDQTIFAWYGAYESSGLLARSPSDFKDTPNLSLWAPATFAPYSMTNAGILIRACLFDVKHSEANGHMVSATLQCGVELVGSWGIWVIHLQRIPETYCWVSGNRCEAFRRVQCSRRTTRSHTLITDKSNFAEILVLEDEHFELFQQSVEDNEQKWSKVWQIPQLENVIADDSVIEPSGEKATLIKRICFSSSIPRPFLPYGPSHIERMRHGASPNRSTEFPALEQVTGILRRKALRVTKRHTSFVRGNRFPLGRTNSDRRNASKITPGNKLPTSTNCSETDSNKAEHGSSSSVRSSNDDRVVAYLQRQDFHGSPNFLNFAFCPMELNNSQNGQYGFLDISR